jgi:methionyl aminopeptidase
MAYAKGYSVFSEFVGHGIGRTFHEPPFVIHTCMCMYVYAATCINVFADWEATLHHLDSGGGPVMQPGMIFTIEPILTAGSTEWIMWNDGWTVATVDQSRTAQYEHTLLITPTGVEILTLDKAT